MSTCKATVILGEHDICKGCLKADVCKHKANLDKDPIIGKSVEQCECFKDKSKSVDLPCKVGDVVYAVSKCNNKIFSKKVVEILLKEDNGYVYTEPCYFIFEDFGKVVFLTREEAEKVLKECEKC